MPAAFKVRALLAGLAKQGEPSSLAGVQCGHVLIERNVALAPGIGDTADDNHFVRVTMATLAATPEGVDWMLRLAAPNLTPSDYRPRTGQVLTHPDGEFHLDRLHEDNGITRRFIVVST